MLSIELTFAVYKKLVFLNCKTEETLKAFANYLSMFDPDWEEEEEGIPHNLKEGGRGEGQGKRFGRGLRTP